MFSNLSGFRSFTQGSGSVTHWDVSKRELQACCLTTVSESLGKKNKSLCSKRYSQVNQAMIGPIKGLKADSAKLAQTHYSEIVEQAQQRLLGTAQATISV